MPISIKPLRAFTDRIPWAKIFEEAENTTKRQRLYPSQSHDQKKNYRLDKGATLSKTQQEIVI
ncbi:hypothetical protein N7524_003852 [Penicillium chrysogenum]|jgi:hypothetical protein|nr:hypothetical protein N7524_003852 [Penicillium chrysogenum]